MWLDFRHLEAQKILCTQSQAPLILDLVDRLVFSKVIIKSLLLFLVHFKTSTVARIKHALLVSSIELVSGSGVVIDHSSVVGRKVFNFGSQIFGMWTIILYFGVVYVPQTATAHILVTYAMFSVNLP